MIALHQWRVTLSCVVLGAWSPAAAATNQIVGVASSEAGACLVKRFQVEAGSMIQGVEFVNNDDRSVFPSVALLRGPVARLSEATKLVERTHVASTSRHRVRVSFEPIPVQSSQEIMVVVRFPASTGVRGVGDGVGIGATEIDGRGDSYIAPTADEEFQWMNLELGINLLLGDTRKATPGNTPFEQGAPAIFLRIPNPASEATSIAFGVDGAMPVKLTVYDIAGKKVRNLVHEALSAGLHSRIWDGRDERGGRVGNGVYIVKLQAGDRIISQKVVLTK